MKNQILTCHRSFSSTNILREVFKLPDRTKSNYNYYKDDKTQVEYARSFAQ